MPGLPRTAFPVFNWCLSPKHMQLSLLVLGWHQCHPGRSSDTSSSSAADLQIAGAAKLHCPPACMHPPFWDRQTWVPLPSSFRVTGCCLHWHPPQQALSYPLKRVSHWLLSLPGARCIWQPFIAPAEEVNLCLDKVFPGITLEVCCCKH